MELKTLLLWLCSTGAGVVAFWVMERLAWFSVLAPESKRIWSIVLTALVAILAWSCQMALGYIAMPVGWVAWVESLASVAAVAFTASQIAHGEKYLSRVSKAALVE
jgi:hypothetical protein